jgi:hypothetical protein
MSSDSSTPGPRSSALAGVLLLAAAVLGGIAVAGGQPIPSPESFDACRYKVPDQPCQLVLPQRTLPGSCTLTQDAQLFCRQVPNATAR